MVHFGRNRLLGKHTVTVHFVSSCKQHLPNWHLYATMQQEPRIDLITRHPNAAIVHPIHSQDVEAVEHGTKVAYKLEVVGTRWERIDAD